MKERIDELIEALQEELLLQKELASLGAFKRDALVAIDMPKIEAASRKEQNVLLALGATAGRRLKLTEDLARDLGAPQASAAEIAVRIGEPQAGQLRRAAGDLRGVMRDVARVTESNIVLTEESLDQVKQFFRLISGGATEEGTYTRQGVKPTTAPPRLMIDEVA